MRKRTLLLFLCGLLMAASAWHTAAQDNTTWENAKTIVAGEEVTGTFTPGTVENLWYKIDITEGKWYEIPHPANYFNLNFLQEGGYLSSWSEYGYNDSYEGMRAIQFQAPGTQSLYIKCVYRQSMGNSYTWSIVEFTDNRVCANAEVIQLDQEITVPVTGQKHRWYKTAFEAGKYYRADGSAPVGIYGTCGGRMLSYSGQVFHAETAGDYYFDSEVNLKNENPGTFRVNEVPVPTNTTKENAYLLELDKPEMYSHIFGLSSLYFKANLEKGKTYEVIAPQDALGWNSKLKITDASGNEITDLKRSISTKGNSVYFTAQESGVYYFERTSLILEYYRHANTYWMLLSEITDPRICTYAVPVEVDRTVAYNHKAYSSLWWKIDVEAGSSYLVTFQQSNDTKTQLSLYSDCGAETPLVEATEKTFTFSATKTGTYYLVASADMLQHESAIDNSFRITKTVNQNNTDIASAFLIEPNTSITTSHSFGVELWYKVNMEAGKVYELNGKLADDNSVRVEVYASNGTDLIESLGSKPIVYLAPDANTMYYIKWYSWNTDTPPTYEWSIYEVNDNRVLQGAKTITIGEEISLTPENIYPNNRYWYKMNVQAGKFYEVDFSNAEYFSSMYISGGDRLELWSADGKTSMGAYYKGKPLFAPEIDQLVYVAISRRYAEPTATLTWKVNQLARGDNRLCEFAQEITVGAEIETKHGTTRYNTQWYKTTLEGGKAYEVSLVNASHDMYYFKGNPCGTSLSYSSDNRITKGTRTLIYVPETSVYYFLSNIQDFNSIQTNFKWTIQEVEGDNRLCQFATPVVLGEEFTIDHQGTKTRWYKLDVEKGFMYHVDYSSISHYSYQVYVYEGCDLKDYVESGSYVKEFAFTAKSTGTYYIKCVNNNTWGTVKCTISTITDNRSCNYPIEVAPEEVISGTTIPKTGLWYKLNLEADKIYEFDFTGIQYNIKGKLYSDCNQTSILGQGEKEKMLFKPTATDAYLLYLEPGYSNDVSWSWSYMLVDEADNRLCEYALEATSDTTTVNITNDIKRFWYTYNVEAEKYYLINCQEGLELEVYTACGQENPLAATNNSFFYKSDNAAKLYIKVLGYNAEGVKFWTISETTAEGRSCELPLTATLGGIITTNNNQGDGSGMVWYHFMPEESGVYTIIAPDVEDYYANIDESQGVFSPYYAIFVLEDCPTDSEEPDFLSSLMPFVITQCGHFGSSIEEFSRLSFEAQANKDYKIVVWLMSYGPVPHSTLNWTLTKTKDLTGTIDVSLVDSEGTIINAQDANVMLYQKIDGAILSVDTLTYNPQGFFESKGLGYGTYLLYANNIGQGFDGKNYLAGWYESAGVWEDATEIVLNEPMKRIEFRPAAAPEDIMTGSVTISGVVYELGESGETAGKESVDISIYRKKMQGQGVSPYAAGGPRRAISANEWELVAKVKTDASGQYKINNLPAGSYMIIVDMPGYAVESSGILIEASEGESYDNNNFETDEENMAIKKSVTGVNDVNASGFKLYPNPFDQEIAIENAKDSRLEIFNVNGICVYRQNLEQEQEIVQANQLPAGIYYFRITKDGKADSFTVIKKK